MEKQHDYLLFNNAEAYRNRNVVERCFGRLKEYRRIATRYDKTARDYLAMVKLLRRHLVGERGVAHEAINFMAYWAKGRDR